MLATALFFALNRGGIAFLFTSNNALPIDDSKPRLERELFALKNNYFQTLEACVRIEPEPELEPLAKEDILTEDEEAEDLIILSVNAPKDEPEIQPGQGLVIPEGGDPNDLSFLEGCWESVSNLFNSITDLPVVYVYCFNKTGKGTATLKEYDKAGKHTGTCESNTTAKRRGDAVVIQDNGVRCGNHRYYKSKLTCRNEKGGTAKCDIDHHRRKFDSNFKFLGKS
ncbi:MAG: hypothetical protein LBR53_12750 [Deltaproteobacteria bacterium]|nr:hypothetical protein [Deltaproteobacteria bacterium]